MNQGLFRPCLVVISLLTWVAPWETASGQAVIAGTNPVTDVGGPDGWTNLVYINESDTFDFAGTGQSQGVAYQFQFWADRDGGTLTPFIAEVVEPDVFLVRAIGTTRRGGVDWTEAGLQTFAFADGASPVVQQGWAAGFISSTPEGDEGGSPIPFTASNVEGWLSGTSAPGTGTPSIFLGEAPVPGATGTDVDAYGKRRYAFQIAAALTVPLPPTDITATPTVLRAGLAAGTTAAVLKAVDGNAVDSHTFSLVEGAGAADNAKFAISGADLKAAVALGGDGTVYGIRVRVQDGAGLAFERALTFSVLGDRPPTLVRLGAASILSMLPTGSLVGVFTAEDPNAAQGDTHAYELVPGAGADDNALFSVETGQLFLQADPEVGRTYRIRVRASDSTGLFRDETFVLPVLELIGNSLAPRTAAVTDTAIVPILYTTGVEIPGTGVVDAVTIPLQSEGQLNLVFRMLQMRPTGDGETFDVIADSGEITVSGAVGGPATFGFPNGPMAVRAGDLFYHYGRGIPFDANQGNARPIWYPCPVLPMPGEPLNLALGNPDFPLREDLPRDYAWAVHFTPGQATAPLRIVDVGYNPATRLMTLTWTSRPEQRYRIRASAGLASWPEEIETGIQGAAGATTSRTFGPVVVPGSMFYRVEETP
jgi:hypothetical protein